MSERNLRLTIPGLPIAQPRQRHTIIAGHVANYTPARHPVQDFKAALKLGAQQQTNGELWSGPVSLSIALYFPRPKAKQWKTKPMPQELHVGRPDLENVIKAVQDALTNVVWRDDAQICSLTASKFVCSGEESPRTEVVARAL